MNHKRLAITVGETPIGAEFESRFSQVNTDSSSTYYGQDLNSSDILHPERSQLVATGLIAGEFGLGAITSLEYPSHHSTTSRKIILHTESGNFFLKEKAEYASSEERIVFCGEFQNALASVLNVVPPLIKGNRAMHTEYGIRKFVLMPAISGEVFMGRPKQIAEAAMTLAKIHNISVAYTESKDYQSYVLKKSVSEALTFVAMAEDLPDSNKDPNKEYVVSRLKEIIAKSATDITDYSGLKAIITHGDYTPSNVLFNSIDEVTAVLDFDNCAYHYRIRDLAEALMTFGGGINYKGNTSSLRHPISKSLSLDFVKIFLDAYSETIESPLTKQERSMILPEMKLAWTELMGLGLIRGDFNYSHVAEAFEYIDNLSRIEPLIGASG